MKEEAGVSPIHIHPVHPQGERTDGPQLVSTGTRVGEVCVCPVAPAARALGNQEKEVSSKHKVSFGGNKRSLLPKTKTCGNHQDGVFSGKPHPRQGWFPRAQGTAG